MTIMHHSHKVTPKHLARKAVVYLRQSSERQVRQNKESQRLQYALADLAREIGWKQVVIVDTDLGSSAAMGAAPREGFDRVIGMVAQGEVGIVLSREVSRLSRTDKDWCHLIEVCQVFDTLIGDAEQVYDLSLLDDQLVLGIKGTLSVIELKVLKMRMLQGRWEKARRGELQKLLPPGYVYDSDGKTVKDPDRRVQQAIELVFRKFRELGSIRQTFLWFHEEQMELPVNKSRQGRLTIVWQLPTHPFVATVLHNPFYAGAYVYGRRRMETVVSDGRVVKRQGAKRSLEECEVFLRDHHEGYIDWEVYEENLRMIRSNDTARGSVDEAAAAVRSGKGILAQLLRCGRCGRRLYVYYCGPSGTAARYLCRGDYDSGGNYCLAFGGATVDRRFGREILRVISPLGVRASLVAIERASCTEDERREALAHQLQQVEYEALRAFEQYDEVDPRNRLVAAQLEQRWNSKLEEVEKLKGDFAEMDRETRCLDDHDKDRIMELGDHFADVWNSERCPVDLKKKIVRTVIQEVIVNLDDETQWLSFTIHWKGGVHTRFEMEKPQVGAVHRTSADDLEIIRRLAVRYGDKDIARVLSRLGRRTGKGRRWNQQSVKTARRNYSIPGRKETIPDPEILTLGQVVKYCKVSKTAIKRLVHSGLLNNEQEIPWAPWEIRRSDLDSDPVRGIIEHLRQTGKLLLKGVDSKSQTKLFE